MMSDGIASMTGSRSAGQGSWEENAAEERYRTGKGMGRDEKEIGTRMQSRIGMGMASGSAQTGGGTTSTSEEEEIILPPPPTISPFSPTGLGTPGRTQPMTFAIPTSAGPPTLHPYPSSPSANITSPPRPARPSSSTSPSSSTPYSPQPRSNTTHRTYLPPQSISLTITSPTLSIPDSDKTVTPNHGLALGLPTGVSPSSPSNGLSQAPAHASGSGSPSGSGSLRGKRPPPLSLGGVDGKGHRRNRSSGGGSGGQGDEGYTKPNPNPNPNGLGPAPVQGPGQGDRDAARESSSSTSLRGNHSSSARTKNAWEHDVDLPALLQRASDLRIATEATTPLEAEEDKDIIQSPFSGKIWPLVEGERRERLTEEELLVRSLRGGKEGMGQAHGLEPVPLTALSFASSGAGSEDLPLDMAKLDFLGKSIQQNLSNRPITNGGLNSLSSSISSGGPTSDPSSPAIQVDTRVEPVWISKDELLDKLGTSNRSSSSPRLLIIDSRPLPAYLASHLDHSVSLMIPSLILRRCKNSGGSRFQGGWRSLEGYLATEGSRRSWVSVTEVGGKTQPNGQASSDLESAVDIVVLGAFDGNSKDGEQGAILESILHALAPDGCTTDAPFERCTRISIRRFDGRWIDIKEDHRFRPHLREGERSITKTGKAPHPDNVHSLLSAGPISPPDMGDVVPFDFPKTAGPWQTTFGAIPLLPPPPIPPTATRHPPARHPSMPSLRISVDAAASPSLPLVKGLGVSKRRPPPPSMHIDTSGFNQRSVSMGDPGGGLKSARPPKLNLNIGSLRSVKQPLRSATLGIPFSHPADSNVGIISSDLSMSPPPLNSLDTVNTTNYLQEICRAQAQLPPSPSSFSGVTRRAKVTSPDASSSRRTDGGLRTARPHIDSRNSSSTQYMTSPDLSPSYTSYTSQSSFAMMSDDDLAGEGGPKAPQGFVVSQVLPGFLFLGPEPTTEAEVQNLLSLGIKRILNVAVECDDYERLRLKERFDKYTKLPLRDCVEETGIGKGVRDACQFIDDARLHSAPTYVHCKAGKSRSVTVVLGYLIHANAWSFKTAYAYVSERRKGISPNIGFVAELMHFEEAELGMQSLQQDDADGNARGGTESPRGNGNKRNKYNRESLPPMFAASLDSSMLQHLTIGADSPSTASDDPNGTQVGSPRRGADKLSAAQERGTEKEVRKNGQYVHSRRAPVNEYTLQPMRRVSKAGLESLRGWASPLLSPGSVPIEKSRTPDERHAAGWL